jgi:hypothetical protein
MAKKRHFCCSKCGNKCEIYKKGKGHRVLVCQNCGIIATNPIPLLAPLLAAAAPTLIEKGGDIITGLVSGRGKSSRTAETAGEKLHRLTQFEKALLMERAERK